MQFLCKHTIDGGCVDDILGEIEDAVKGGCVAEIEDAIEGGCVGEILGAIEGGCVGALLLL